MRGICNVDATIASLGGSVPKWNKRNLTWAAQDGGFAGLSNSDILASCGKSFAAITKVCNLHFAWEDRRDADIIFLFGHPQGGPNGVLADMMLPPGDDSQLRGRIDTQEPWTRYDGAPTGANRNKLDLDRTLLHEIGHGVGLPHLSPGNLLQPYWSESIWTLQSSGRGSDVGQLVQRYGAPTVRPDPDPDPLPGEGVQLIINLLSGGKVSGTWK